MPAWLDIDPHGRVAPGSDDVRRALADRAGRFSLLPSTPDLLVAHRAPATGGAGARPRVLLAGDLSGFPIADFIAFVHQARLSGVLTVTAAGADRSVAFKDGEVRSAQSSVTLERLGEVARKLGFVTAAQLEEAFQVDRPLGKALVEKGFIGPNDLWKCFHEQVTAVFHAILLTHEGVFWLLDEDVTERAGTPLAVSTQTLLMDGIRRIDEMSLFQARIPGPHAFLRRREPKRPITLKPAEQQVLDLVDGRRDVAAVAGAAHLNEFDATKILYHLAEAGYVESLTEPSAEPLDPAARLEGVATGLTELLCAVAAAVAAEQQPGFLAAVRSHLGDEATPFSPLFRKLSPAADGGLDRVQLLANLAAVLPPRGPKGAPPPEAPRLLFDALRELLFFYLFLAGERIPREVDEQLGAQVKQRLAKLDGLVGA